MSTISLLHKYKALIFRHSFYDDFRYINFSRANVNIGNAFDIRDGIFHVPVTGLYLFSIHAMPMQDRPFKVQIHHNGKTVAAFANGNKGKRLESLLQVFQKVHFLKGLCTFFNFMKNIWR